jgi:uncharacterized protein YbjT (DUF2867 family)
MKLLILGATGAVGGLVLQAALKSKAVAQIIAPTRKPLGKYAKLENPLVDFDHLDTSAAWWHVDAVICALGTTIKVAGSQEAFAKIDRDLPILVGEIARTQGATRYGLNSSLGASMSGNFYLKTKAQAEAGIRALGFESVTIVRPSLIDTERLDSRPGEQLGLIFARTFKPLIPKKYRAVPAENIALALLNAVIANPPGVHIIESEALQSAS